MSAPEPNPGAPAARRRWGLRRPATLAGWAMLALVAMVLLVAAALFTARYGPVTNQGRLLIEARTSGLKLGRLGRLKLEGLGGDIWQDFTVRRLTISDENGVWLEADRLSVRWSYAELLRRRLKIDAATADRVRVLRRPTLAPKGPASRGLPVNFDIDALDLRRVETLPAFSTRQGVFHVTAKLHLERRGAGQAGEVRVRSLTHAGDFLAVRFDRSLRRPLMVDASGMEARGGALAGALGLPADQPFSLRAKALGEGTSGRLEATLTSGTRTPVWARGAWARDGGQVGARVDLNASTLTARYVRMFGADARLGLAARRARDGSYGVAARLQAPNLSLAAAGPADLQRRSSRGLRTSVVVADVSRLLNAGEMRGGRAQGVLSGTPARWRFQGEAAVEGPGFAGYRLARTSGPVVVTGRGREVSARGDLVGAGGKGGGWLAGLAGAGPRARLELTRLADGRLLIRRADIEGAAATLNATGSRTLFGGLNFKGRLQVPRLAAAVRGATGGVEASWSADQARGGRPWVLTLDGRGRGFASGQAELDRLLGPAPRLRVEAAYEGGSFAVSEAQVEGDKASATAQGRFDPGGQMALQTRWRADGPFQIGPVQISGRAAGEGAVTGTLSAPRADLTARFAQIDIPRLPLRDALVKLTFARGPGGAQGQIAVEGASEYGPARGRSDFRFAGGGVELTGLDADAGGVRASGALSLRGAAPSSADLRLAIGPGVLLTSGQAAGTLRIVDGASPTASVSLQATNAAVRGSGMVLRSARISGSGPLSRLPLQIAGEAVTPQGPVSIDGQGLYQQAGGAQQLSLSGAGRFRQVEFRTLEPILFRIAGRDRSTRMRLALGGGRLDLDARQSAAGADATAVLRGVDIRTFDQDFAGRVDADVLLRGQGGRLEGTMTARLDDARSLDAESDLSLDAEVRGRLEDTRLALDVKAAGAKGLTADVSLVLPVEASAAPLRLAIVRNRPVQGRFDAQGEVQPLWNLFYGSERELAGQVKLQGTIGGSLNDPQLTGTAAVANGRFNDFSTGLRLTGLSLNAQLRRDLITLTEFSARDEKSGSVTGSGSFSLERGGGSNLKLDLKGFRLLDNDTAEATATGEVTVTRAADGKVRIEGELLLDRAEINAATKLRPSVATIEVIERNLPARPDDAPVRQPARGPSVSLDVRLRAPRRVFVKGRGVDAELSLRAHVTGTMAQPVLDGTARVVKGDYDFAGKRFEFDEEGVIYLAGSAEQIRLDLAASWEAPTLTATVRIRGTAAKPEITLTSSPSLPQEEVLSQVIFGASASQLSGAETAQLASTVTALATGGGFDVLGSLRQFARLDRLAIGGNEVSGVTVAGGKYIAEDVYLEIVGGGREGPTAEVTWRVRRGFSIASQVGGQIGAKLSIRWTRDLGRERRPDGRRGRQ